jgi:methylphosphotriester-DNA--protein-cysteine methyltransferase
VTVTELVEQVGTSQRTVERLCHRHFGFSPKLLLRRQRFMRSLAQFMLDPSLKWIGAMDSSYHDQAQFVRDFHEFMSMTPREYAAMPHPILDKFMHERARIHGAAVQTLDRPDGTGAGS